MDSHYSKLLTRITLQTRTRSQKPSISSQISIDQSPTTKHKKHLLKDFQPGRRVSSSSRHINPEVHSNLHILDSKMLISFDGSPSMQTSSIYREDPHLKPKLQGKEKLNSEISRLKGKVSRQKRELKSVHLDSEFSHTLEKIDRRRKPSSKSFSKKVTDIEETGTEEPLLHICEVGKSSPVKRNKKAVSHYDFNLLKAKMDAHTEVKSKKKSNVEQMSPIHLKERRENANPKRMRTVGKLKTKKALTQETFSIPSHLKSTADELGIKGKVSRQKSSENVQTASDKTSEDYYSSSKNRSRTQSLFPNENVIKEKKVSSPISKPMLDLKSLNLKGLKIYTTEKGPIVVPASPQKEVQSVLLDPRSTILSRTISGSPMRAYTMELPGEKEREEEQPQQSSNDMDFLGESDSDEVVMFETSGWALEAAKEMEEKKRFDGEGYLRAIVSKLKKETNGGKRKPSDFGENSEVVRQELIMRNVNNYLKYRRKDYESK